MFTGLVSISFRQLSPEEILQWMVKANLRHIEWGSDVHAPCGDLQAVREVARLQQQYGVTCCAYGTYFRLGVTPPEELPAYFAAAKILGTDILRIWCGKNGSAEFTDSEREQLFAAGKEAAAMAEAAGVRLCTECHPHTQTDTAEGALAFLQAVNSPAMGTYWQPNQYRSAAENVAYAKALAPYTTHIHVFHWQGKERFPLLQAKSDWTDYLSAFDGDHGCLLEFMPDDMPQSLPTEADALRQILKEGT